jgi:hypothetical protein
VCKIFLRCRYQLRLGPNDLTAVEKRHPGEHSGNAVCKSGLAGLLSSSVRMVPMDRDWRRQELSDHRSLRFEELARVEAKSQALRLGYEARDLAWAQSCAPGKTAHAFGFTDGQQTVTVPNGVTHATVFLSDAQGVRAGVAPAPLAQATAMKDTTIGIDLEKQFPIH